MPSGRGRAPQKAIIGYSMPPTEPCTLLACGYGYSSTILPYVTIVWRMARVEYLLQSGIASRGYTEWSSISRSPGRYRNPEASHTKVRELAHAKSRTFFAVKCQLSGAEPAGRLAGVATSSGRTIKTGVSAAMAWARRARCVTVSTSAGFCSRPVARTMWSRGTVTVTSKSPNSW